MIYDVWGRRPERHEDPNIAWSLCNGCPELTVKDWSIKTGGKPRMQDGERHHPYFCNKLSKELSREEVYDMTERKCPVNRKLGRKR